MQALSLPRITWKRPGLWIALISVLVAATAGNRASARNYEWPHIEDRGGTQALSAPAFLLTAQQRALIWRPSGSNTPLVFASLTGEGSAVPIVPYSDVEPGRWKAVPAGPDAYHLIWLERDGRLRSALIATGGQTLRGPIDLATDAQPDYEAVPLYDGGALVFWITAGESQLAMSRLDSEGRPGQTSRPMPTRIDRIAVGVDQNDDVHLVWLASASPNHWSLSYQVTSVANVNIGVSEPLSSFVLSSEARVASLSFGLDQTHGYIFLSTVTVAQPETERVHALTFPLDQPADVTAGELELPQHFTPSEDVRAADLTVGQVGQLIPAPHSPAALRWPRPAAGQHTILPVAIALHAPDGWRPGVVYYRDGAALGFQIVGERSADGGPPTIAVDPSGKLHLAWSGLQGIVPHLYTAEMDRKGLVASRPQTGGVLSGVLAGIVAGMPLGTLWIVLPTCLVLLSPDNTWTLPLAFALYGLAKLVWPPALFARLSPPLAAAGLGRIDPGLAVALGMLLIAVVSATVFRLAYPVKRPLWQRWLVYAMLDAALTWGIFGANVFRW
jgi:hypothetical protein